MIVFDHCFQEESMYPQILYWKWNDELLDENVLVEKANDIIKRSSFRDIAIAPHSMKKPEASFFSPVMQKLVRKVEGHTACLKLPRH